MRVTRFFLLLAVAFCSTPLVPHAGAQQLFDGNQNLPPFGSFTGSDFDTVGLQNGNLHLHIPIASWKQRGGKTLTRSYVYDAPSWSRQTTMSTMNNHRYYITTLLGNSPNAHFVIDWGGWEVSSPIDGATCKNGNVYHNWVVTDPEGTKHPLDLVTGPGLAGCFGLVTQSPTTDGSGMMVNLGSTPPLLTLKDGSQITLSKSSDYMYLGSTLEDDNGNLISTLDTLNRSLVAFGQGGGSAAITDSNGTPQTYQWSSSGFPATHTYFCGYLNNPPYYLCNDDVSSGSPPGSSKLTLPDGSFYLFSWVNGDADELQSITLPTGATISYTYGSACTHGPLVNGQTSITAPYTCRATVTSRTITINGVASTWNYSGGTVTDPYGNDEVHVFSQISVNSSVSAGTYETSVSNYQGSASSGKLLRQVVTDYIGEPDLIWVSNTLANIRPIRKTTTLDSGLVTKTETDYETFTLTSNGNTITGTRLNPTEKREYAYGSGAPGALLRRTDYAYLHNNNSTYATLNIVDRPASVVVHDGSGNTVAQTTYEYDVYNHTGLPSMGVSGAVQHDSARSTSYSTRGNQTGVSRWLNTNSTWLTTNNQYDDAGNLIATKDPNGNLSQIDYTDSWSNSACAPSGQGKAYPTKTTNALNQLTKHSYASCTGFLTASQNQNDINASRTGTTTMYDLMNRAVSVSYPDGGQTTNCYTDVGGSTCTQSGPPFQVVTTHIISSSPLVNETTTSLFDGLDRVTQTQLNSDPSGVAYVDTTYDLVGRTATVSNPYRSKTESTYGVTSYIYDALNRTCVLIPPDGTAVSSSTCPATQPANDVFTTYVGNTTTVTDQGGKSRRSVTDGLGRLTQVFEDPAGLNYETDYAYDTLDSLLCVGQKGTNSGSFTNCASIPSTWRPRTFTYDSLSRLLSATNPESGTTNYTYDANGNLITKTAPAPNQTGTATVTTTYSNDALNRITQKSYSDGTTLTAFFAYEQTNAWGTTQTNTVGRLTDQWTGTSCCATGGAEIYSYDPMGRIVLNEQYTPVMSYRPTNYTYDFAGNMLTFTDGVGETYTQTFNAASRVTQLNSNWVDFQHPAVMASGISYNPAGAMRQITYGNGLTETAAFNNRLQPCRYNVNSSGALLSTCTDAIPSGNLQDFGYGFNAGTANNGNVASMTATGNQVFARTYTYDALNRLSTLADSASAQPCKGLSWTYDPWANRSDQTVTSGTCNTFHQAVDTNNRLLGAPYQYDAAGNMTHDASHSYTYDAENRLIQVDGGSTASYVYDAEGRRVQKTVGSTQTDYIYDLSGNVVSELNSSTWFNVYLRLNGKLFAQYTVGAPRTQFIHTDHLGSTRVVTSFVPGTPPNYSVYDSLDYLPFGEQIAGGTATTHKFTGKERDSESNLDNFGARYNSSSMGRFMSPDQNNAGGTQDNPQSWNLYTYVRNNPLNAVDPDGRDVVVCVQDGVDEKGKAKYNCRTYSDQDYQKLLNEQQGQQGVILPSGNFPSGLITCGGQVCGFAAYYEPPLEDDTVNIIATVEGIRGLRGLLSLSRSAYNAARGLFAGEEILTLGLEGAAQAANAAVKARSLAAKEAFHALPTEQKALLQKWLGRIKNTAEITPPPPGLTKEAMLVYKEAAQAAVEKDLRSQATQLVQPARILAIDRALGNVH
jgi:RHS repeat-associated protein